MHLNNLNKLIRPTTNVGFYEKNKRNQIICTASFILQFNFLKKVTNEKKIKCIRILKLFISLMSLLFIYSYIVIIIVII